MYIGTAEEVAREVYDKSISRAEIPRGLFFDSKKACYVIHKVGSTYFNRAEWLSRYALVGVYNRITTAKYIQDDIEDLHGDQQ